MTKIISAFPASGKSYLFQTHKHLKILDSDSSKYSWILDEDGKSTGIRNPNFLEDYYNHIQENIGKVDVILVSSHQEVRDMLNAKNLEWYSVMPHYEAKAEWVGRCFLRGSGEKFCQLIADKWEEWVPEQHNSLTVKGATRWVTLQHGEYLSDHINWLLS